MKKTMNKIWLLIGILLLSISILAMLIPNALAQDANYVNVEVEVQDGCDWTGTPYDPASTLDVWDNEICIIRGTGRAALEVIVHEDGVIKGGGGSVGGQPGGRLIIGSLTTGEHTVFTVGGQFWANGIVEVGNNANGTQNPSADSTLIANSGLSVSQSGSNGNFDIVNNTAGQNTVDINNSQLAVGSATTTGSFTHNDDSTITISAYQIYGILENLNAGGIITLDGSMGGSTIEGVFPYTATFDNRGTFNTNADLNFYGSITADNTGTIEVDNGNMFVGDGSTGTATFNNDGPITILDPFSNGKWVQVHNESVFTNTDTINTTNMLVMEGSTINNTGTINATTFQGTIIILGDPGLTYGDGIFNNDSGGIVNAIQTWVLDTDFGTGPGYTDRPTLNNDNGASFTTESLNLGFSDNGTAWLGLTAYGSILNNDGTFVVSGDGTLANPWGSQPSDQAVNLYRGAKINNTANGTFTVSNAAGNVEMSITGAPGSECGATDDIKCEITNTNTTDANAFDIGGELSMWQYASLNNNGNMIVRGTNNIDVEESNVSIVNGSTGDLNLAGGAEVFEFGVAVDNDGEITGSGPITFNDTASLDNSIAARITNTTGGGGSIILNNTSHLTNAGTITLSNLLNILDDAYYDQSAGSVFGANLYLDDVTSPVSPYFTMTGGTAGFTTETRVYDASTVNINGGTFEGTTLSVGEVATQNGGVFNIDLAGSASFSGLVAVNDVYQGTLDIKSTSTATTPLSISYTLRIDGDLTEQGIINHGGSGTVNMSGITYIYGYGELNINDGTWDANNYNNYVYADVDPYANSGDPLYDPTYDPNDRTHIYYDNDSYGKINIGTNGTFYNVNILYLGYFSGFRGGSLNNSGNVSTPSSDIIYEYNGGKIENSGTINLGTGSYIYLLSNENYARKGYLLNESTGSITCYRFYTANQSQIVDNLGSMLVTYQLYLGYTNQGGVFNNGDLAGTTPGDLTVQNHLYVQYGGEFNNHADSIVTPTAMTINGEGVNGNATFNQFEGTDAGAQVDKVVVTNSITVGNSGAFDSEFNTTDYIKVGTMTCNASGKINVLTTDGTLGSSATQDAKIWSTSGVTNYGEILIEGSSTDRATWDADNLYWNYGTTTNNGLLEMSTSQNNLENKGGIIYSSVDSEFILPGLYPGFEHETGAFTEFAGTVTASSIEADDTIRINYDAQTADFTVGQNVSISGAAEAIITADVDNGTTGTLTLNDVRGTFSDGQVMTDALGGSATVDGSYLFGICFGDYTGGNCTHSSTDPLVQFTQPYGNGGDSTFDINSTVVQIANDMTFLDGGAGDQDNLYAYNDSQITQTVDSFIDFQDDTNLWISDLTQFTSNGNIDIQGTGAGAHGYLRMNQGAKFYANGTTYNIGSIWMHGITGGDTELNVSASSTVNLNDTHVSGTLTNATVDIGSTDVSGSEYMYLYGTMNLNSGTEQNIYLGTDTTTNWNVDGLVIVDGGLFRHTSGSTGTLDMNQTSIVYVGDDGTATYDLDINGPTIIGANYGLDQNGPHGMYVDGNFQTQSQLTIENDGLLDVGLNGETTVSGSTTDVYGLVELDGTLNAGDLTVYSGGIISSGDGGDPFDPIPWPTYQGCGPNGVFGCSSGTNFDLNVSKLDVQAGGYISSDGVSEQDRDNPTVTYAHGGSYGGEGVANGAPDTTHGDVKASSPLYGDQGEKASNGFGGHGGGGVHIDVVGVDATSDGSISIDGEISADGYSATYDIPYSGSGFNIGAVLSGPGTEEGIIVDDTGSVLTIYLTNGIFSNGQAITDDSGGSGTITSDPTYNEGGGAGGTVIINQTPFNVDAIFDGAGTISANGGNGTYAGGGGRILINSILLDDPDDSCSAVHPHYLFTGSVNALGGSDGGTEYAAAGTIVYTGDQNNSNDTLIVDQGDFITTITPSTTAPVTRIPASGDYIFDRVDARNAAKITYETTPLTDPVACYENDNGSSVTGPVCTPAPDKPDTMNLGDTATGAQQGCGTTEPSKDNPVNLYTVYPVMSFVYRNPEDAVSAVSELRIQVDDNSDFSSPIWDSNVTGLTQANGDPITPNTRTEDITYAGPGLSTGVTYYVRAAFVDASTNQGLWSHYDIDDYYRFLISGNLQILDSCSGAITLTKDGLGVDNPSTTSGGRYATESCNFGIISTEGAWRLLFGFDPSSTLFENAGQTASIAEIDNEGTADCSIDTDGAGTEEEWGYNISSADTVITNNVNTNGDCSADYDAWTDVGGVGQYVFDVEPAGSEDEIVTVATGGDAVGIDFDLNIHATVNNSTSPDDYSTNLRAIITSNP